MGDPVIAVGGENLIDNVLRDGVVSACPGGAAFNVALALGRQKANVRYVTPISTDAAGDVMAKTLGKVGVDLVGGRSTKPTTLAHVTVADGQPSYRFDRGATAERDVTVTSLAKAIGSEADILHTGGLALAEGADADAWVEACIFARDNGCLVSVDLNVRPPAIMDKLAYRARLERVLKTAQFLKISDEDVSAFLPDRSFVSGVQTIRELTSAPLIVLTCGADGARVWHAGVELFVPAVAAKPVIDTVGAGDTFIATILSGLASRHVLTSERLAAMQGEDLRGLLDRASRAAALTCTREGCDPPDNAAIG